MKLFSDYLAEAEAAEKDHGTYASLSPAKEDREKLHSWMEHQHIKKLVDAKDYHCTVVYSTKSVPEITNLKVSLPIKARCKEWKVFGPDKMLVIALKSSKATALFNKTIKMGAKTDYPSYIPHITVALGFTGDLPKEIPNFDIQFVKFKVGTIDEDFSYNDDDE